jgi:hypothetical protein
MKKSEAGTTYEEASPSQQIDRRIRASTATPGAPSTAIRARRSTRRC